MEETQRWEMSQQRTRCDTTAYSLLSSAYWYLMGGPGPSSSATSMKSCGTFSRSSCSFWKTHSIVVNLQLLKNAFCCWKLAASEKCIPLLKTYWINKMCSTAESLQLLKNIFCRWKIPASEKHIKKIQSTQCYSFWGTHSTIKSFTPQKWIQLSAAEKLQVLKKHFAAEKNFPICLVVPTTDSQNPQLLRA